MSEQLEMCADCGELTGRAGKHDDSLYCVVCDAGPFCETCMEVHDDLCENEDWPS